MLLLIFLQTTLTLDVWAQTTRTQAGAAFPRIEPDPKAQEFFILGRQNNGLNTNPASDQTNYSWKDFAEISLWASGDSSAANLQKIIDAVETLKNSADLPSSEKEKAEFILTFLHSNILKSYSLYQTRVDTVFSNGRFNCVSSAVLYMIFCESAGLQTSGVVTKDHAFITVHINEEDIDVETTNKYGFDPGNRKEFHDQFGRLTGFSYVPARNYRDRQTISRIELVSLILNNRISDHERQNRFAEAVPLAVDRAILLLGETLAAGPNDYHNEALFENPRKNLIDRLLNYGAWLLRSNREEDALRWAASASSRYADDERWQEFILTAANNRIARLIRSNNTQDARTFLENQKTLLTEISYAQLDAVLTDAQLLRSANQIRASADGEAVITAIEQAREDGKLSGKRAEELYTFAVQKTASTLSAAPARNWRLAIQFIETAITRFGSNRELEQSLQTYKSNLSTDYHNRFAAEWNKRNYEEAERILLEGLAEFPNDRQLQANKQRIDQQKSN